MHMPPAVISAIYTRCTRSLYIVLDAKSNVYHLDTQSNYIPTFPPRKFWVLGELKTSRFAQLLYSTMSIHAIKREQSNLAWDKR